MGRPALATLLAAVVLVASTGCGSGGVDPATLPGVYRAVDGDGSMTLDADGAFVAQAVPVEVLGDVAGAGGVDLVGTWEHLGERDPDVVYLSVDEVVGGASRVAGVQLHVAPDGSVFFRPDPDRARTTAHEPRG